MKSKLSILFIIPFVLLTVQDLFSQKSNIDSLKKLILTNKKDTAFVKNLIELGKLFQYTYPDSAIFYHRQSIKISNEIKDELLLGEAMRQMAFDNFIMGQSDSMLVGLRLVEKITNNISLSSNNPNIKRKSENLKAKVYSDLAVYYEYRGEMSQAVSYYEKAIEYFRGTNDWMPLAANLSNLGSLHANYGNLSRALEFFSQAYKINAKNNFLRFKAANLTGIGAVLSKMNQPAEGIKKQIEGLKVYEELADLRGAAVALQNIATGYQVLKQYKQSEIYYSKTIEICKKTSNKKIMMSAYVGLAGLYMKNAQLNEAKKCLEIAIQMSEETKHNNTLVSALCELCELNLAQNQINEATKTVSKIKIHLNKNNSISNSISIHSTLYKYYKKTANYKDALVNKELMVNLLDSAFSSDNKKQNMRQQFKFEYEKQAAADSVAHAKESDIKNVQLLKQGAEIKAKKNQQYALFGGLGLVIIFAGFMFNRFKITQKQKFIIQEQKLIVEEQKNIVEEKQKEILDSIYYARRIQSAHLPNEKIISKNIERLKKI